MSDLVRKLSGGDRRSIGRSSEVVAEVLEDISLFSAVFEGILSPDPIIRMRAADVAEKVSAVHPECLQPFKEKLLGPVAAVDQQEVRWHVAQMVPRLELSEGERVKAVAILLGYLEDRSQIVKTFAIQALADLAVGDAALGHRLVPLLQGLADGGSPAVKNRARRLLANLRVLDAGRPCGGLSFETRVMDPHA